MRRFTLKHAAVVILFLPLAGGCAPSKHARAAYPPGTHVAAPKPADEARIASYASFSTGVALDMQAAHLEEIYAFQNMSTGVKQPSLIRDARRLRMKALAYLDRALSEGDTSGAITRRKGDVLLQLGDARQAMDLYRGAERIAPADSRWYFATAAQLELAARFVEAAEVLGWAVKNADGVPADLRAVALVEMGGIYAKLENYDAAEKAYTDALAIAAAHPARTRNPLGDALANGLAQDPTAIRRTLIGILKRRGRLDEALAQAQKAVTEAPNDARAVLVLSGVYEAREERASAITTVEQFLASNPTSQVGVFALIHILASGGMVDEAVERGRAFLAAQGSNPAIETEIIAVYQKAGRSQEAEEFVLGIEKDGPLDPRVAISFMDMLLSEGKTTQGLEVATKTLELQAADGKYQEDVFGVIWSKASARQAEEFFAEYNSAHPDDLAAAHGFARVLRNRSEAGKAADIFVMLAERQAPFDDIYDVAALRLLDKGDDYTAARVFLKGANSGFLRHPEALVSTLVDRCGEPAAVAAALESELGDYQAARITACQMIARLYGRADNNAKAEEYYRQAIETPQPSLADYAGLAVSLYRQDKNDEAIQLVEKLREQGQGAPPLLRMLVGLLAGERKYDEAEKLAEGLVREKPTDVDNRIALANLYMQKEDYASAERQLMTAEDLAEGDTEMEINVRYLLGVAYEEQGKNDEAVAAWKKNLTVNADEPDSSNALAYHYAVAGTQLDEALELVGKALASESDNEAYLDTLGWVYYRKGDIEKALDALVKAAAKRDDPVIYDHLGDAYLASGQKEKAVEAWRKALDSKPKAKDRPAIEEKVRANGPEQSNVSKEETCPDTATGQR